ncbi:HPF/RaiA family ribosome-associated protein [Erythrobacter sp. NE805]|uniref:HPF/RaiA family ribosome-associated protein n=1 Tax=Erythrobacter sp. NE805 TaxID=3389875 RepID=UPI00396AF159
MSTMHFQFNTNSSLTGTRNVAARIEAQVRQKLARYEDRLTRLEVHVADVNSAKHGADDKHCTIEARPRGSRPIGVTGKASNVDAAARIAANIMAERLGRIFGKAERHRRDPSPEKQI